jgi:hypothetical protein
MKNRRNIIAQRGRSAWQGLRGRPPKRDYGLLIVLPFLAAAGGAFLGQSLESAVRLLASRTVPPTPAVARGGRSAVAPAEQSGSTLLQ